MFETLRDDRKLEERKYFVPAEQYIRGLSLTHNKADRPNKRAHLIYSICNTTGTTAKRRVHGPMHGRYFLLKNV
jgi:hypothetical protein